MNKPCLNCGRLITVPDIPLPYGYTQKCKGCGFDNPVADDDPMLQNLQRPRESAPNSSPPNHSTPGGNSGRVQIHPTGVDSAPADHTRLEHLIAERVRTELRGEFEQKMRAFEAKMSALAAQALQSSSHPSQEHVTNKGDGERFKTLHQEISKRVAVGEAVVFTQTAAIFKTCEEALVKLGFKMTAFPNVSQLLQSLKSKEYQLIILDQKVLQGEEGKAVLTHIKHTHLPVRRCQATVLITPNLPSFESQIFYQWGIDLNLNPRDLDKLGENLAHLFEIRGELLDSYLTKILA